MKLLRLATLEDFEEVNRMALGLRAIHAPWRGGMSDDPPYPMERYQESIRENCLFIAFVENQTVGYLNYFPHYGFGMNEELRKVASIEELYLDAPYRNRGIGQQILREIFEYARQQQCEEISLSVDAANTAAFSLYQKLGFSIRSYGMKLKL